MQPQDQRFFPGGSAQNPAQPDHMGGYSANWNQGMNSGYQQQNGGYSWGDPSVAPQPFPNAGTMPQQFPYNGSASQQSPNAGTMPQPFPNPASTQQQAAAEESPEKKAVPANMHMRMADTYQVPDTGFTYRKARSRKPWIALIVILLIGLALFLMIYFRGTGNPQYAFVERANRAATYTGDAVIVRAETVFTQEGVQKIRYQVDEGALVRRGTSIATVYSSGFSSKEWTKLENYRNNIKEYHQTLIGSAVGDSKLIMLLTQIKSEALAAQQLIQGGEGSLTEQEERLAAVLQDRQIYLKQKYPDDQKLIRLYEDENSQLNKISSWTKQYGATADGLISFYTDGFETALNMSSYSAYSPAEVRKIYQGHVPDTGLTASKNTVSIYRVVRQEPWAVLVLCNEKDWMPITGEVYELQIENFEDTVVQAQVDSFTRSGGELLVRLIVQATSVLPDVLYIRSCNVTLGENVTSLRVPLDAIYIRDGRKGVVMSTSSGEYWTGVEVISQDSENAFIVPEYPAVLYEGVRVRLFN